MRLTQLQKLAEGPTSEPWPRSGSTWPVFKRGEASVEGLSASSCVLLCPDGLASRTVVVDADDGMGEAVWLDIVPYVVAIQGISVFGDAMGWGCSCPCCVF